MISKLYTLKEAVAAFGSRGVSEKSLRREIYAGNLRAMRARPSRNSKLLISEQELERWIKEKASVRQYVSSAA